MEKFALLLLVFLGCFYGLYSGTNYLLTTYKLKLLKDQPTTKGTIYKITRRYIKAPFLGNQEVSDLTSKDSHFDPYEYRIYYHYTTKEQNSEVTSALTLVRPTIDRSLKVGSEVEITYQKDDCKNSFITHLLTPHMRDRSKCTIRATILATTFIFVMYKAYLEIFPLNH